MNGIHWIWFMGGKGGPPSRYHAFLGLGTPEKSVCGQHTTTTYSTRIPGSPNCEECTRILRERLLGEYA